MMSAKLTPVAATWMSTWPGAGWGAGRSWYSSTSGAPKLLTTTAFMATAPPCEDYYRPASGAGREGEDGLHFDGEPSRQFEGPHGGARVRSALAPERQEQVGCPVDHRELPFEARRRIYVTNHLHDLGHLIQVADRGAHRGQNVEGARARRRVAYLFADVTADLAAKRYAVHFAGGMAGREQQLAHADGAAPVRARIDERRW